MTTTTTSKNPVNVPQSPIDETLNETELGGWIARNKVLSISLVAIALIGVIAYGVTTSVTNSKHNEYANSIYQFEQNQLGEFQNGKLKADELVSQWKTQTQEMVGFGTHASVELSIVEELISKNESKLALELLERSAPSIKNKYFNYFYSTHLASLYEDMGEPQKAIDSLKPLVSSQTKFLEGKLYVDLGRLHLALGQNEEAKASFKYVTDNIKDAEFTRIANLYLSNL
tara:strand:+ start:18180 stop:18866 length:687 start_codon:yes stop_codon:yes gene_type:complete